MCLRLDSNKIECQETKGEKKFKAIFDNFERLVYIADPNTYEVLYVNNKIKQLFPGEIIGKKCYEVFHEFDNPCSFCTNKLLFGKKPKSPLIFNFFNEKLGKWFHIIDQAIFWDNDRNVRFEMADDITEQKNLEELLKTSEENYRVLYEDAPNAYFTIKPDQSIKRCNNGAVILLGYSKEEFLKKKITDLYADTSDGISKALKIFQRFLKGEIIRDEELQMKKKDGKTVWISLSVNPIKDHEGNVVESRSIVIDISQRKQFEQILKKSEEKFKNLSFELEKILDTIPGSIFYKDTQNNYIRVNKYIAEAHNSSKADLEGKSIFDLYTKEQAQAYWDDDLEVIRNRKPRLNIEEEWETKDGLKWVNTSKIPYIDENEEIKGIIGISMDITEKKIAEQKLKESEAKYRGILENIKEGYFEVDLRGNFTFINNSTINLHGYSKGELLGTNYKKFVDNQTAEKLFEAYNYVYKTGSGLDDLQYEIIRKDGKKRYFESTVYLRFDTKGNKIGFYGIVRDITDKKRSALLREKFNEQLENEIQIRTNELRVALEQQRLYLDQILKASQIKNEFLATMSHELRTPLNAIIGFTELLLEETYGELNNNQLEFIRDIKSSAEHQFEMVKTILDISEIESGQTSFDVKPVSLNLMINQVLSSLKPLYSDKDIKFKIKGLKKDREIFADPNKFKVILRNLLSNAIKFTIEGQILIMIKEDKENWLFSVKDTGIGIDQKDFDLVFKEFKRIDSGYVKSVPGTGLGLPLTKMLVNLHGGNITLTSKLGIGSNFTFTIPKAIAKRASIKPEDFLNIL